MSGTTASRWAIRDLIQPSYKSRCDILWNTLMTEEMEGYIKKWALTPRKRLFLISVLFHPSGPSSSPLSVNSTSPSILTKERKNEEFYYSTVFVHKPYEQRTQTLTKSDTPFYLNCSLIRKTHKRSPNYINYIRVELSFISFIPL